MTTARRLRENAGIGFIADVKGGPFDIPADIAARLIASPNPDGRSNRDVLRPWANGLDTTRRPRGMWIIDFGVAMPLSEAALYEAPFEYVRKHVKPFRDQVRRRSYRDRWWLHVEPGSGMRRALSGLRRYIATPLFTKHRLFVWLDSETLAIINSSPSPGMTTTRSESFTRAFTSFGLWQREPSWKLAHDTRRPQCSRPSHSRARPTSNARRSPRQLASSSASATAGSIRPASIPTRSVSAP